MNHLTGTYNHVEDIKSTTTRCFSRLYVLNDERRCLVLFGGTDYVIQSRTISSLVFPWCPFTSPLPSIRSSPLVRVCLSRPITTMLSVLPLLFLPLVAAQHNHGNGMDMSMDGPMDLAAGQMIPYFHFTPGDILWFQGWVPKSAKAMVGACLALFLFGIFERWLACLRAVAEQFWRKQ